MAKQLILDLPARPAFGRDDYYVSQANQAAFAKISDWKNWTDGKLVLCGPGGAGKTHLAHVWASEADAQVVRAADLEPDSIAEFVGKSPRIAVEDVENIAGMPEREQALFHMHNLVLADAGRLLLTSQLPPAGWPLMLPDLKSRVMGTGLVRLDAPDDALLSAVMVKLFVDRQIEVKPEIIGYLTQRMERSFTAAGRLVAGLDALALSEGRAITQSMARQILDNFSASEA